METLTGGKVQSDIIALLEDSELMGMLSGKAYAGEPETSDRPRDSKKEDAVVIFRRGTSGQVREGAAVIHIYIPDRLTTKGVAKKDKDRILEVEAAAETWVRSLRQVETDYYFELSRTIHTINVPEIHQHCVVVHLNWQCKQVFFTNS